jgi:hypothetical protein
MAAQAAAPIRDRRTADAVWSMKLAASVIVAMPRSDASRSSRQFRRVLKLVPSGAWTLDNEGGVRFYFVSSSERGRMFGSLLRPRRLGRRAV